MPEFSHPPIPSNRACRLILVFLDPLNGLIAAIERLQQDEAVSAHLSRVIVKEREGDGK